MANSAESDAEHLSVPDYVTIISAVIEHRGFIQDEIVNFNAIGLQPPPRVILESLLRAPRIRPEAAERVQVALGQLRNFEQALEKTRLTVQQRTLLHHISTVVKSAPVVRDKVEAVRSLANSYREHSPKLAEAIDVAVAVVQSGVGVIYASEGDTCMVCLHCDETGDNGKDVEQDCAGEAFSSAVAGLLIGGLADAVIGAVVGAVACAIS